MIALFIFEGGKKTIFGPFHGSSKKSILKFNFGWKAKYIHPDMVLIDIHLR